MATKSTKSEIEDDFNNTGTNIQVLKSIEKAYFRNNPDAQKRNTANSLKWFSQYVPKAYNRVRTSMLMRDSKTYSDMIVPGFMYFFVYDAVHKDTLPVWDRFPLVFPWDSWSANGHRYFIGINLHYLSPAQRFVVMNELLKVRAEKRFRVSTKLKISWKILQSMGSHKLFEHAVKMYRLDAVRSKFIKIPSQSWELSAFLPTARWEGDKSQAWKR